VSVVIDTNVVSYLFKGDTRARRYHRHLAGRHWTMAFMTLAELDRWALRKRWGQARKTRMEDYLRRYIIYPLDRDLCLRWAQVTHGADRAGRPIECADAWIAATALALGVPLVTHNVGDYAGVDGLTVLTEATA
jgi:tRNA(fMet)-specific endonuclease VapC